MFVCMCVCVLRELQSSFVLSRLHPAIRGLNGLLGFLAGTVMVGADPENNTARVSLYGYQSR